MKSKLEQLTEIKARLDENLELYRKNHALWAKWLAYAKKQKWFDDWCFEQAMRLSDLKAEARYISKAYKDSVPDFAYNMGAIYYSERHSYSVRLDLIRQERSKVLHDLWTERNSDGGWVYSLAEIAEAYGVNENAMYKAIRLNDWFHSRRSPGQTHIPKKYLKPVKLLDRTPDM